jgi:hypothetical protein
MTEDPAASCLMRGRWAVAWGLDNDVSPGEETTNIKDMTKIGDCGRKSCARRRRCLSFVMSSSIIRLLFAGNVTLALGFLPVPPLPLGGQCARVACGGQHSMCMVSSLRLPLGPQGAGAFRHLKLAGKGFAHFTASSQSYRKFELTKATSSSERGADDSTGNEEEEEKADDADDIICSPPTLLQHPFVQVSVCVCLCVCARAQCVCVCTRLL